MNLNVALEEGFTGESVLVLVNGKEAFRENDVRTRMQIGLATSFETDVPTGPARVEVRIPSRNISGSTMQEIRGGTVYVGVSLEQSQLRFRASSEPFGYV